MEYIDVVLIGTAKDGPDGIAIKPDSWEYAEDMFGLWSMEVHAIPASGVSVALQSEAIPNQMYIYQITADKLYQNPLYSPTLSGNTVSFGSPGTSGEYIFKYIPIPREGELIPSLSAYLRASGSIPHVWRISGTRATAEVDNILFRSKYCGSKYNGITISYDGSILELTIPNAATNRVLQYDTSNYSDFVSKFLLDSAYRKHPVEINNLSLETLTLPVGTWSLTGGTDGTFTKESVLYALQSMDLETTGLVVLCGGLSESDLTEIVSYVESQTQAACIIATSPEEYKDTDSTTYLSYLNSLAINSDQLLYAVGWGNAYLIDSDYLHTVSMAPVFAGAFFARNDSPNHVSTQLKSAIPSWSKDELESLPANFCIATRFIETGIGFIRSSSTSGRSIGVIKTIHSIVKSLYPILSNYLGAPASAVNVEEIGSSVENILREIPNIKNSSYEIAVIYEAIKVSINLTIYGEINSITFNVLVNK